VAGIEWGGGNERSKFFLRAITSTSFTKGVGGTLMQRIGG